MLFLKQNGYRLLRTIGVGIIGIFSVFICILSFEVDYMDISKTSPVTMFSTMLSLVIIAYVWLRFEVLKEEYWQLHQGSIAYIEKISKEKWLIFNKQFLASILLSLPTLGLQSGLVWIVTIFKPEISPEYTGGIAYFVMGIINFFIQRIYLFNFRADNYAWQISCYSLITLGSTGLSMIFIDLAIESNFWILQAIPGVSLLLNKSIELFGLKIVATTLFSILFGWLPYLGNKNMTFRKRNKISNP